MTKCTCFVFIRSEQTRLLNSQSVVIAIMYILTFIVIVNNVFTEGFHSKLMNSLELTTLTGV